MPGRHPNSDKTVAALIWPLENRPVGVKMAA